MEEQASPQLFEANGMEIMAQHDAAAVARATQEIQAALVIAQRFPRDEVKAETRIMQACRRKGLAEIAEYEYSRGGTRITGPTIDLLRAIANRWGNIQFGWEETDRRSGQSSVRCFAWDLQTNGKAFRTFFVRHWRDTQAGGYAVEDERDIYELIANQAARRVRACLEEVIDADIVEKAVNECRRTLKEGEKLPIKDRAAKVLLAFSEFGVTQEMIETRLGNKMDAVSENQLASLRRIYKALQDGVGRREDYFKQPSEAPKFSQPQPVPAAAPVPAKQPSTPSPQVKKDVETPPQAAVDPEEIPFSGAPEPDPVAPPPEPPQVLKPPKTAAADAPSGASTLRLVRDLCRVSKIKENTLLNHLAEIGASDGSAGNLEELQLTQPGVLQATLKGWASIAERIKATT